MWFIFFKIKSSVCCRHLLTGAFYEQKISNIINASHKMWQNEILANMIIRRLRKIAGRRKQYIYKSNISVATSSFRIVSTALIVLFQPDMSTLCFDTTASSVYLFKSFSNTKSMTGSIIGCET